MLNFQAVLTNVKFDIDCRNVLYFDNREAQENYFSVASLFSSAQSINFNAGSLIETTIIYQVQENENINDILSKNYCIIKDNNENATLKYYYYFVKNAMQDSGNQVKVWLELDIFQTYFIDMEFSDCEILKAHLNRFVKLTNGDRVSERYVTFDGGLSSNLFEREPLKNLSKRLIKRTKLSTNTYFKNDMGERSDEINNWLDDNVVCWVYAFFDKTHEYQFSNFDTGTTQALFSGLKDGTKIIPFAASASQFGTAPTDIQFRAISVPILKNEKQLFLQGEGGDTCRLTIDSLTAFMSNNNDASFVSTIKLSNIPPFSRRFGGSASSEIHDFEIDEDGNLTIKAKQTATRTSYSFAFANGKVFNTRFSGEQSASTNKGLFVLDTQNPVVETTFYKSNANDWWPFNEDKLSFEKSEIVSASKNSKYNPKLLSMDYRTLRVCNQNGQGFDYDLQKLNKNRFSVIISEPLLPTVSKGYLRIKQLDGIYSEETTQNMTGAVIQFDSSLTLYTDQYKGMLANQKNYHMQAMMGVASSIFQAGTSQGAAGGISGALAGKGVENAKLSGGTGSFVGMAKAGISAGFSLINTGFTIDNMQQAPDSYTIGSQDIFLSFMSSEMGVFIEEYECIENEKEIVNDQMCLFGYTYGKIGNLKDFTNIRKFYNYIEADIQETRGIPISKAVHERFKAMFARGVRFWNNDSFSYELENYERWLEA